jgi:hypothetical protein
MIHGPMALAALDAEPMWCSTVVCESGGGTYRRALGGGWYPAGLDRVFTWKEVVGRIGAETPCWVILPTSGLDGDQL